jgi:hypothetical protein
MSEQMVQLLTVPASFIEEHTRMMRLLANLEEQVSDLLNINQTLDREDIAKRQGVSLRLIYKDPWRQPNFGRSEFGDHRFKWSRKTYLDWEAHLEEHRQEWLRMSPAERRIAMGDEA